MTLVGGLRARMVRDSIYNCIGDALEALGWFNAGREHAPLNYIAKPIAALTEIPLNTLCLSDEVMRSRDLELGSTAVETRWLYYVDFYAEDDIVGKDLINDVRDILGGRMSSIGRSDASIPVYDYQQATPPRVFTVGIENLLVDRAHDFPKPWQQHWYACRFDVVDAYGDDQTDVNYDGGGVGGDANDILDGGSP